MPSSDPAPVVGNAFRWPARHSDGPSTDPDAPPMGAWLRLKPTVVVDDLPEQARVVARALQEYGMVLAGTGGTLAVAGTVDRRWDDDQLLELGRLTAEDFEVVDASGIMVSADSMEARPVR